MKLIILTDAWHPQVNGVVRTYEHFSSEMRKAGHEVKVVSPLDFPRQIALPGYTEIKLALAPYKKLKKIIETYNPDCIHISTEGPIGWAGRKYCIRHQKNYSTSFHTQFPDYFAKRIASLAQFLYNPMHKLGVRYVRHFHRPSSRIMVPTQSMLETLRGWGFKNELVCVTRGANLEQFSPGEKTAYNELKKPIALYVGRIAIEKNLEDFLSMEWDGSKVIVGDGPSKHYLQHKYPKTYFAGTRQGQDLANHYRSADVFVFPSRTDTFGMVLVEAMACGLPVAAYNVTGPKDIITHPFLGALSENDLSEAALRAMENGTPEMRAEYAKNNYTWDIASKQYEKALVRNDSK